MCSHFRLALALCWCSFPLLVTATLSFSIPLSMGNKATGAVKHHQAALIPPSPGSAESSCHFWDECGADGSTSPTRTAGLCFWAPPCTQSILPPLTLWQTPPSTHQAWDLPFISGHIKTPKEQPAYFSDGYRAPLGCGFQGVNPIFGKEGLESCCLVWNVDE